MRGVQICLRARGGTIASPARGRADLLCVWAAAASLRRPPGDFQSLVVVLLLLLLRSHKHSCCAVLRSTPEMQGLRKAGGA